ncbi:class I SAM-dependent methyltransferase [Cohnella luojiensis]|uniref:Class I SAM-dependent methyltransferase n=1 Tax=Cohnella luojiensis TaxID=652876 RepID=A0A4Y8LQ91_9BACL|nr:class I SAM-dependent methyltransferase [Cohnella luojiensis]TFE23528.1 class I SAM-dependent methyltransferase [Cohnella luojiensis]
MTEARNSQKVHWEAGTYDESMSFVSRFGEDIVQWLNPQKGERIVDFGCGTGDLAARIATKGAEVLGVDISPEMVERARTKYPLLSFQCSDGLAWKPENQSYDAVFSNAALHWMKDAEAAVISMTRAIRSGGRLVAELGGHRNVDTIISAVKETLITYGREDAFVMPWYFPKVGEYASLLEKYGMEVKSAELFDRPTPLEDGEQGMKGWLEMFGTSMFPRTGHSMTDEWIQETVERLKETALYDQGKWTADYRRLRIFAVKK